MGDSCKRREEKPVPPWSGSLGVYPEHLDGSILKVVCILGKVKLNHLKVRFLFIFLHGPKNARLILNFLLINHVY